MLAVVARDFVYIASTQKVVGLWRRRNFADAVDVTRDASEVLGAFGRLIDSLLAHSKLHRQTHIGRGRKVEAGEPDGYENIVDFKKEE